eukprot:355521-Chlamydomonas_euryale.AAC.11
MANTQWSFCYVCADGSNATAALYGTDADGRWHAGRDRPDRQQRRCMTRAAAGMLVETASDTTEKLATFAGA